MEDKFLRVCLQITAGMGVFILGMQIIGITGFLKKDFVRALLILGIALVFLKSSTNTTPSNSTTTAVQRPAWDRWFDSAALLILLAFLATTIYKPLTPPTHWDELMYHLPHIREWLSAKQITVNEWLRYPYFPYNFNLLYAALISINGDYDASLMHAIAGWLITLLLFRFTQKNHGSFAAILAVAIWLPAVKSFFETSYIDLGQTLFIFTSAIWFILWAQDKYKTASLLIASAFFLGLAAGTKYQAAIYPPFFILAAALHERRLTVWIKVAAAFLIPCIYWYARNLVLTGNPVNPLAGSIFGYYDWNAGDFAWQMEDLGLWRNFPPPAIWLALVPLLLPVAWKNKTTRWMMLLSIYSTSIWYFTSHYDRYLVPQYPLFALLGSAGLVYLLQEFQKIVFKNTFLSTNQLGNIGKLSFTVVVVVTVGYVFPSVIKEFKKIPTTAETRHKYINDHAPYFAFLQALQEQYQTEKIYQLGLEGGLLYGPRHMYGDHFGPWRYGDYISSSSAFDSHKKLSSKGFEILAVDPAATKRLEKLPNFHQYFSETLERNGAKAYRILK
ncbi:MAG: hypothetical protein WBC18_21455 [Ottowia sp.]|uniref:ArnT family glycosyltransferase n=1 Tax=Ottowia sp. TaxID=1898956 RepID=UPI003C733888